ncbi:MAG: methionyl-tRNA formyltransferase [Dehalococcoidia bacterium]|nr:methionyl-tRNA formyltransferase [Dehalococcoidia bacterium]
MGSPEFAVPPLCYLVEEGYEVAAVYTKQDKPAGRGRSIGISPVKQVALALGLIVRQPKSLKEAEIQEEINSFCPDVIVVCAYGQILPQAMLALPKYGCLNIHPSLLPRHRGAAPVAATIMAGDGWGGTSLMLMDEGLDTGPVLMRAQVRVRADDTTGSLMARLALISARLLLDALPRLSKGELALWPQDNAQATYFKMMAKEAGEIDWAQPAVEIGRRVRAFQPWPTAYTYFQGRLLKVLEARVVVGGADGAPGMAVALGQGFGVITGAGVLEILKVQLESRQAVSGADFLRGQRGLAGGLLPS